MDATQFVSALLAIVVIDVVLAGDNAIVIALAARGLPAQLQQRAIVWGTVGAIGVRILMTMAVVWLLGFPGLLLAGGALLLWIAYRLLLSGQGSGETHGRAATTFWAAMRTIVVADAAMGLDNVLAVAGAAHGSYALIVAGLLISVPLVVWGSTLVLKVIKRYPGVVYLGAGVLVWTAVQMMTREPLIRPWLDGMPLLAALAYLWIPLVLWAGFVSNHRRLESRIHDRLAKKGGSPMWKILIPIDGSANALGAVRQAVAVHRRDPTLEVHLLNVQPLLPRHITRFVSRADRTGWLKDRADAAMAGAVDMLSKAGVRHSTHWTAGNRASEICAAAERLGVDHIVMGTARRNSLTRMFEDSTTEQVLAATAVPVEVVVGDAVSGWERWGLPVGVLAGGGLLLAALE